MLVKHQLFNKTLNKNLIYVTQKPLEHNHNLKNYVLEYLLFTVKKIGGRDVFCILLKVRAKKANPI